MDKFERRRHSLIELTKRLGHGAVAEVSSKAGIDPSYVSRMRYPEGKPGRKRIGEDLWDKLVGAFPELDPQVAPTAVSRISEIETRPADSFRIDLIEGEADMGDGRINEDYPEVLRAAEFPADYIRSVVGFLPPPGRLVLVTGRGNSMVPVIQPGDSVIVDIGCQSYEGDGLYLINSGNGQQIKSLQDRGDAVYVVSANELYPPFPFPKGAVVGGKVYLRARVERFN
ncbi:S24 family peptidase [Luteimonas sp. TWI662]|uniref:S24 family peptidase n=1 Tax=Luteimonas sp. TWI662 TaxID=3136789 RepID=UPI00320A5A09